MNFSNIFAESIYEKRSGQVTHPLELLQRLRIEFTHTVHVYPLKRECLQGHQPDTNNLGLSFCEDHPQLLDQKTQVAPERTFHRRTLSSKRGLVSTSMLVLGGYLYGFERLPQAFSKKGNLSQQDQKKGHAMLRPSREAALRPVCGVIEEKAEEA